METTHSNDIIQLASDIKKWGEEVGFSQVGIADISTTENFEHFNDWLKNNYHGDMKYLEKHRALRSSASTLLHSAKSVISCRLNYYNPIKSCASQNIAPLGRIATYALDTDYHQKVRVKLLQLAKKISTHIGGFNYRVFCDSAPLLEKAIAEKAGLGWIGKNGLLINKNDGSYFFLGEIVTDLQLPFDNEAQELCGTCQLCIKSCPTKAIISPHKIDARRCISYLTIENKREIPIELRPLIGNRIFGCDTCQRICPWNKQQQFLRSNTSHVNQWITETDLNELFLLSKEDFLKKAENTPLSRINYECWLRNVAIALGNSETNGKTINTLKSRLNYDSDLVREHVIWAIKQHAPTTP